jgi:serine/threonine-protein kinase
MSVSSRLARCAAVPVCLAALAAPAVAHAQGSTAKVAAEALFEEGRRLMADGKAAEACPKFADSERIEPSPGTLLNLASCYEKINRPATAWATYREAASLAASTGRQDLVATAQRHADALSPKLPRLSVTAATTPEGFAVALDGVTIAAGVALPVDPGEHTVDATAPSFKPWSSKVTIGADATTTAVAVPALEAAPAAPAAPVTPLPGTGEAAVAAPPGQATAAGAPPPDDSADRRRSQHTTALIVGGAGVVAMGVSGVLGLVAKGKYNDSLGSCPRDPNLCSADGVSQRDSARTMGNVATAVFAVGAGAVVAGVIIWVASPSAPPTATARVELVPAFGGAAVKGVW